VSGGRGKRVAIVQSNYIPWKGYFDLIASVDEFVLLDDAQYTRRDWRNRNLIKCSSGAQWLTIPVQVKGNYSARIRDIVVSDPRWTEHHWRTLVHEYSRAAHFGDLRATVESWYAAVRAMPRLSHINAFLLRSICDLLGIGTPLRASEEFDLSGERNARLISICAQAGADVYVSGPAAQTYLDEDEFRRAGISVEWMDYSGYPEYEQLHPPFDHRVSILDLLFNTGASAPNYMKFPRLAARDA